jgi:DNA polymerase I-like protein with 3'-5' exonuclease and polymerase domains
MCKKLGHGSNYGGEPETLANQSKLPIAVVSAFQPKYFAAFPAHRQWHEAVRDQLRRHGYLLSLTGRKRYFFGRRTSPDTFREALAYDPQCSLADGVNTVMLNLWRSQRMRQLGVVLWAHDHDALTWMYPADREDEIVPALIEAHKIRIPLSNDRMMEIPFDCKVGWNKGDWDKDNAQKNPDGLKDYVVGKGDSRKRSPKVSILDRPIRRKHG